MSGEATQKRSPFKCWWIFFHDWQYLGEWGIAFQKCRKCGKLKIVSQ